MLKRPDQSLLLFFVLVPDDVSAAVLAGAVEADAALFAAGLGPDSVLTVSFLVDEYRSLYHPPPLRWNALWEIIR